VIRRAVDVSQGKVFLEPGRKDGRREAMGRVGLGRSFVRRGLEAWLKAELTVLRESEAGETNSRNGYRQRSLSLPGAGQARPAGATRTWEERRGCIGFWPTSRLRSTLTPSTG
jgi:hypothetical protein